VLVVLLSRSITSFSFSASRSTKESNQDQVKLLGFEVVTSFGCKVGEPTKNPLTRLRLVVVICGLNVVVLLVVLLVVVLLVVLLVVDLLVVVLLAVVLLGVVLLGVVLLGVVLLGVVLLGVVLLVVVLHVVVLLVVLGLIGVVAELIELPNIST